MSSLLRAKSKMLVKDKFDEIAKNYGEDPEKASLWPLERDSMLRLLKPCLGMNILDSGSGWGRFARELLNYGTRVVCLDFSNKMIKKGKRMSIVADFVIGDIYRMPFRNMVFDAVVNIRVIKWLDSPLSFIFEGARIVKNNGYLAIYDIRLPRLRTSQGLLSMKHSKTIWVKLKQMFTTAGFMDIKVIGVHYLPRKLEKYLKGKYSRILVDKVEKILQHLLPHSFLSRSFACIATRARRTRIS